MNRRLRGICGGVVAIAVVAGISGFPAEAADLIFPLEAAISVTRTPAGLTLMPYGEIAVQVTIINGTDEDLRGIYYAEHIPAVYTVHSDSISIDGAPVDDYIFETSSDDVYHYSDVHRWIIEEPDGYDEMNNPLPAGATLTISFRIGTLGYFQESWPPYIFSCEWPPGVPPSSFGYCEETLTINSSEDTDGDGLADEWEIYFYADLSPDGTADGDEDGLMDLEEHDNGSAPDVKDTDSDGMEDGWEVDYGLDPVDATDAEKDFDADGLSNLTESGAGTNPNNVDSDDDGLEDYDELAYDGDDVYDPYDPVGNPTGTDTAATAADTDGDGFSDYIEVNSESSPVDESITPLRLFVNFSPSGSEHPPGSCRADTSAFSPRGFGWH